MSQAHKSSKAPLVPAGLEAEVDIMMQNIQPCDAAPATKQFHSSFFL